jgi:hypothetical protein
MFPNLFIQLIVEIAKTSPEMVIAFVLLSLVTFLPLKSQSSVPTIKKSYLTIKKNCYEK